MTAPSKQGEAPNRASLAPTLFEGVYGADGQQALQEAMHDEELSVDQRVMATELLIGTKQLASLTEEEKFLLDEMTRHLVSGGGRKKPKPTQQEKVQEKEPEDLEPYNSDWSDE